MEMKRKDIEVVKVAVRGLENQDISVQHTLERSIEYLKERYDDQGDPGYLIAAVIRMEAYLELGFCYEDGGKLFDDILECLGTCRKEQFPKPFYYTEKIPLTRSQVKRLLGRWNGSRYHTMTVQEVVDDIIQKVSEKQIGKYEYHSNANPNPPAGSHDLVYVLVVEKDSSYLYNVQNNRYYTFIV